MVKEYAKNSSVTLMVDVEELLNPNYHPSVVYLMPFLLVFLPFRASSRHSI